jgi:type VI secretion system protein ImpC
MSTNSEEQMNVLQEQGQLGNNILDEVISATGTNTERDYTEGLLKVLTEEALDGVVSWDKSFIRTVGSAVTRIDKLLSDQVNEVLHNPEFQKLEGTWRGLHHLVKNSLCSAQLKIKVLNVDKTTLLKNFDKAIEFDQSELFKKIYEEEYGSAGGAPYGALIGDYEFTNHPQDIKLLKYISEVSAASFSPFISSASSSVMGLNAWNELSNPTDLERIFDSPLYAGWNNFRKSES